MAGNKKILLKRILKSMLYSATILDPIPYGCVNDEHK